VTWNYERAFFNHLGFHKGPEIPLAVKQLSASGGLWQNGISENAFEFKMSCHVAPETAFQIIQAIVMPESQDSFHVLRAGRTGRQW
jgi:hypothetical protein